MVDVEDMNIEELEIKKLTDYCDLQVKEINELKNKATTLTNPYEKLRYLGLYMKKDAEFSNFLSKL